MTVASTIGTGQDYGTPALWEASISADASEPHVGTIMVDEAFTGLMNFNVSNTGGQQHTIQVDASVRHSGTPASGARIETTTTNPAIILNSNGPLTIDGLELKQAGTRPALRIDLCSGTVIVKNCLMRQTSAEAVCQISDDTAGTVFSSEGNLYIKEASSAHHVITLAPSLDLSSLSTFSFTNDTVVDAGGNAATAGIRINDSNATFNVNNVEVYGCAAGCFVAAAGSFSGTKNRSSDTTAPGATNYRSEAAATHLVSVTAGSFDLRRPTDYDSLQRAGDQLAGTTDFDGHLRVAGTIPIGADYERLTAASTTRDHGLRLDLDLDF